MLYMSIVVNNFNNRVVAYAGCVVVKGVIA